MPENTDVITARLQELLRGLTTRKPIEQAIVAVESGDHSFRWVGAKGEIDSAGGQMLEETPFFIASIDKLYNATIAMMLSETGRLNLDDAIATYLPSAITRGLHQFRGFDHSERITVRSNWDVPRSSGSGRTPRPGIVSGEKLELWRLSRT